MAIEKLAHSELAKIGSRQEALQTIFLDLLDIFYPPIFGFVQKNRLFQQPQALSQLTEVTVKTVANTFKGRRASRHAP